MTIEAALREFKEALQAHKAVIERVNLASANLELARALERAQIGAGPHPGISTQREGAKGE